MNVIPLVPAPSKAEPYLDKRQLADEYGRSSRWVDELARDGLPAVWVGNARRFRLSEVHPWLLRRGIVGR